MSTKRVLTDILYSSFNTTIGPTGSMGSLLKGVGGYTTKTAVAFLGSGIDCSGSVSFTGSFDGANVHRVTGSVLFNSGSLQIYSFTTPFVSLGVYLTNLRDTAVSGSLYLLGQQ